MKGTNMAGKSRGVRPYTQQQMYGSPSTGSVPDRYRPRTPAETVDDAYTSVVQATALNTVTHMAMDAVHTLAKHRDAILAETPGVEAELNAIGANAIQGFMDIQRQVSDNVRRYKGGA